jgi:hypothetical protein
MIGPLSVVAAATIQFLGSALAVFLSGTVLWNEIQLYLMVKRSLETYGSNALIRFEFLNPLVYLTYIFFPLAIGLLGMASSIGLLCMREWARKATIFLATVPVSVCVLLVILRPRTLFPPDPGQGTILAFGGGVYLALLVCLLIVLIPVSIWLNYVLTRESVRSLFSQPKGPLTLGASSRIIGPHP